MRKVKKLRPKYGKLTVIAEETRDGRRYAIVNCNCGAQKAVLVDALTSGRTRSCGALRCKQSHSRIKPQAGFSPKGSRTIPLPMLRRIWKAVHAKSPITIAEAARRHNIKHAQTLYSALRAVRTCGGIDEYARRVQ